MADRRPSVVASVLNWNNYEDTVDCIESLQDLSYDGLGIVLVDNGSSDGSGERLAEAFPEVTALLNDENLGFSGGHNTTINYALERDADYVWMLNNDIVVPNGVLKSLVEAAEEHDEVGMVIPQVMVGDAIWFKFGRVSHRSGHSSAGPIARFLNDLSRRRSGEADSRFLENDYVPFCATLFDMELFREVGTLPEEYFLYNEDVDYCWRVTEAGYRILTDMELTVQHDASSSSGGALNPLINYYISRNRWLLARRMGVSPLWFVLSYLLWLGKRGALSIAKGRLDGLKALLTGGWDGLRGNQGRGRYP